MIAIGRIFRKRKALAVFLCIDRQHGGVGNFDFMAPYAETCRKPQGIDRKLKMTHRPWMDVKHNFSVVDMGKRDLDARGLGVRHDMGGVTAFNRPVMNRAKKIKL